MAVGVTGPLTGSVLRNVVEVHRHVRENATVQIPHTEENNVMEIQMRLGYATRMCVQVRPVFGVLFWKK